ncbi:hypothetical protein FB451DRAFT_1557770, partial [Mycena latifolia]
MCALDSVTPHWLNTALCSSSSLSTISPASTTSVDLDISTREALRKTRQKFIDAMQKAADAVALLPIPADMNGWERLQIQEKNADLMAGAREPHIRQLAAWEESLAPAERGVSSPISYIGPVRSCPLDLLRP